MPIVYDENILGLKYSHLNNATNQCKNAKENWKITETLAHGYSSKSSPWKLFNEYQGLEGFSKIVASLFFGGKSP